MLFTRHLKLISVLLIIAIVAIAAGLLLNIDTSKTGLTVTVENDETLALPKQTVSLDVILSENTGITDFTFCVDYDHDRLELVSINPAYVDSDEITVSYLPQMDVQVGKKAIDGVTYPSITAVGEDPLWDEAVKIFSITFRVIADAPNGFAEVKVLDGGVHYTEHDTGEAKTLSAKTISGGIYVGTADCEHIGTTTHVAYISNENNTHLENVLCSCGKVLVSKPVSCLDENADKLCDTCGGNFFAIEKIKIDGVNMTLGNDLIVNFLFKQSSLPADRTLVFKLTQLSGSSIVKTQSIKSEEWENYSGGYFKVAVPLSAKQMADTLQVELLDGNGLVYNEHFTISVREYAHMILENPAMSLEAKKTAVDMLNYGAAAQVYFAYNTEDLANSQLTPEQQVLATAPVKCVNSQIAGDNFYGTNLSLEERIIMNLYFDGLEKQDAATMYAEITYTNYKGEHKNIRVPSSEIKAYSANSGIYRVSIDEIVLADARSDVTVTLYHNDGRVYGYATDSLESIAARGSITPAADLYSYMMRFSTSAYNYLGGTH